MIAETNSTITRKHVSIHYTILCILDTHYCIMYIDMLVCLGGAKSFYLSPHMLSCHFTGFHIHDILKNPLVSERNHQNKHDVTHIKWQLHTC